MADLAAGFYPQKRPRADMRTASFLCASDEVVFMNQYMTKTAGLLVPWAGAGIPEGLALEERQATGKIHAGNIAELNNRIILDVSGPKILLNVDGVSADPAGGDEIVCDTDNLNDSFVQGEVGPTSTIGLGIIDEVLQPAVTGNVHQCWVQLFPREHFGTLS